MFVRYSCFIALVIFVLFSKESKSQHALNFPSSINPTFLCDFQIVETFLYENGSGEFYAPFDSTLYKYDVWKRPERVERYLRDSLIGESKLEYDRVNKYTRITSLQMDTFYLYNDCGLIEEKNVSTGSSDPKKASFRYRYNYDEHNQLINITLWDLKSFETDFIIEDIFYSYNHNGQVDSITTTTWLGASQQYATRIKSIHYNPGQKDIVEKNYSGNLFVPELSPDSTTIINYNEFGLITSSYKLIPNNGNVDTIQSKFYNYNLNNQLFTVVEGNFINGVLTYGQFWKYDYDVKQNLKLVTRSESFDGVNWTKMDRIRYVVRGQYVPMASTKSIEVVPNPATCCADIIFYSDEYDLVKVLISDMTGKIVLSQIVHIFPGRNLIPLQLENFTTSPIINRQIYLITVAGTTTFSRASFIKL